MVVLLYVQHRYLTPRVGSPALLASCSGGRKEFATGPFFGHEPLNGPSLAAALSVESDAVTAIVGWRSLLSRLPV